MSERVFIFDTTLRDGEQSPGATMNQKEKIRLARQLESLGVDIIEAGFPASSEGDFRSVQAIAEAVGNVQVAALTRAMPDEVTRCYEALKNAKNPRIHTFLATSDLHMREKLGKTPQEVMDMAIAAVSRAKSHTQNVQFSCEDASRSNREFLVRVVENVIDAGATTVNIPDTVGYAQPQEFYDLIKYLLANVKNADKAVFAIHCHNDLGLGTANTLAALSAGARQAEVTLNGIGERAGNAALEEVVMALRTRSNLYQLETNIKSEQIYPSCRLLSMIIGQPIPPNKAIIGGNAFAHESGIHQAGVLKCPETYEIMTPQSVGRTGNDMVLGKHSGKNAVKARLDEMGFMLTNEQVDVVTEAVKALADKKKEVLAEDLEAVVLEQVFRLPDKYKLKYLSVLSGNMAMPPTAALVMEADGEEVKLSSFGVGPVDAIFNTISQLTGRNPSLLQYAVNAITGGTDAQGEVVVRLEEGGKKAVGRASDADVMVASAKAFINALNRLAKKEEEKECDRV
ncbi:2-isopropylmalate synthase [Fundidesulfovibrio butyratiphilus]